MNNQNVYDAYQRLDEALVTRDFETAQKEVDFLYEEEFGLIGKRDARVHPVRIL